MKTVTFCGHSTIATEEILLIEEKLYIEIEKFIQQGVKEFLLGGYGKFDIMCAKAVKKLKGKYPHITSVLIIPYMYMDYNKELYDCSEYPPIENVPRRYAILKRNEYMINRAECVIAYVKYSIGGAAKTYQYAMRKNKEIINLAVI